MAQFESTVSRIRGFEAQILRLPSHVLVPASFLAPLARSLAAAADGVAAAMKEMTAATDSFQASMELLQSHEQQQPGPHAEAMDSAEEAGVVSGAQGREGSVQDGVGEQGLDFGGNGKGEGKRVIMIQNMSYRATTDWDDDDDAASSRCSWGVTWGSSESEREVVMEGKGVGKGAKMIPCLRYRPVTDWDDDDDAASSRCSWGIIWGSSESERGQESESADWPVERISSSPVDTCCPRTSPAGQSEDATHKGEGEGLCPRKSESLGPAWRKDQVEREGGGARQDVAQVDELVCAQAREIVSLKSQLMESQRRVEALEAELSSADARMEEKVEALTQQLRIQEATAQRLCSPAVVMEGETLGRRESRQSRSSVAFLPGVQTPQEAWDFVRYRYHGYGQEQMVGRSSVTPRNRYTDERSMTEEEEEEAKRNATRWAGTFY